MSGPGSATLRRGGPASRGDSLTARARARRRRARAVGTAVLGVLVAAGAAGGWWAWREGVLDTREVTVRGADRTGPEAVRGAVGDVLGTALPLVDTGATEARVEELPLVVDARVSRRWPGTLVVEVRERDPVAAVPVAEGFALLDAEAVTVETVPAPPDGLPVVLVDPAAGPELLDAARTVALALPPDLAGRTSQVAAASTADVRLVVDGREVRWGGPEQSAVKADVLRLLLREVDARVYDVSAPGAPATAP